MIKRTLAAAAGLILLVIVALAIVLASAHRDIRDFDPPLPEPGEIFAVDTSADLPVSIGWINTASQVLPRSSVIEASLDPDPGQPYVMSFPAFALTWPDGRRFLIDAGMEVEEALAFGRPAEMLPGSEPITAHGGLAERLAEADLSVTGIGFTHLHTDHTQGLLALCARNPGLAVHWTRLQAGHHNYTTSPGAAIIAQAGCSQREIPGDAALKPIPGFPGLSVFNAAGHTPGSQVFVAQVRSGGAGIRTWIFVGDIANHGEAITHDLPKPHLYSLLIVPEATGRLGTLRRALREWRDAGGASLLVSHDQRQLESSGIAALTPGRIPR